MEEIRRIGEGIRSLEIQGARNVALAGLRALKIAALEAEARTTDELLDRLSQVAREISLIRVTEPGLRNVLATVLSSSRGRKGLSIQDLREHAAHRCDQMREVLEANIKGIIRHGGAIIPDGSTIFTHCHSSSVTKLIMAQARKKDLRVLCTETRPRWQGRKTARELSEVGIDTTLFVDSAAFMYLGEADLVLIGSDAVGGGRLYNKIGSYMVIHFANRKGKPAYSVCETQKFDPLVGIGYVQPVEERPQSEVMEGELPFRIRNPAFETVPLDMFTGIVTERGILSGGEIDRVMHEYDHLIPELKKLVEWERWEE